MSISSPSIAEQAMSAAGGVSQVLPDGKPLRTTKPKQDLNNSPEPR